MRLLIKQKVKKFLNFQKIFRLLDFYMFGFLHLRTFKMGQNPKIKIKKCKINSRVFTYDGLTFSTSSLVLEVVKDEI
jgi:hypothetical protein